MNSLRISLPTALLLCAALSGPGQALAGPQAPTFPDLSGMVMDSSGALTDLLPLDREDRRDNLAMFGRRPTLVVVATQVQWRKSRAKDYVKSIKELDKLAAKWKRDGLEMVFIAPNAVILDEGGGKPLDLELLKKARPKHMICATADPEALDLTVEQPVRDQLLGPVYTEDLEFNWVLLEQLGVVSASGSDILSKAVVANLTKRCKALEAPAFRKGAGTQQIFDALCEWRLGEAQDLLSRMEGGETAEQNQEELDRLRAMLAESEEHYRQVFCAPYRERGYLPEYAERLALLAERYCGPGELGARITAEIEEVRETAEFQAASEHRARYLQMLASYEAMDAEVQRIYEAAVGKRREYDEGKYNQAILDVYPETLAELRSYVESQGKSPYRKRIALLLMDAQEDLQYAQQIVRSGS